MSDQPTSAATFECPSCGTANEASAARCQGCGSPLPGGAASSSAETVAIRPEDVQRMRARMQAVGHTVAYRSDIGKKHRVNQDSGGAWTWQRGDGRPASLVVVADGVSAGRNSEEASRLVVDVLRERMSPLMQDPEQEAGSILQALVDSVKEANHRIARRPYAAVTQADASTVVCAFAVGSEAGGAWVGDSRVYLVRGDTIRRLTRDHSWAEEVVSSGIMTVEQAAQDRRAHMIMRWLGPPDQDDPGIDAFQLELEPGDIIFCCTDGLYMYFSPPAAQEAEIARVFVAHGTDLQGALDQLLQMSLDRGGYDNITVAAVRVGASGESSESDAATVEVPSESANQTVQLRFPGRQK